MGLTTSLFWRIGIELTDLSPLHTAVILSRPLDDRAEGWGGLVAPEKNNVFRFCS